MSCGHLGEVRDVAPRSDGCEDVDDLTFEVDNAPSFAHP
jgi:hypothetical protein